MEEYFYADNKIYLDGEEKFNFTSFVNNLEKLEGTFNRIPVLADIPYPVEMEPNLVVEYYSR